MCVLPSETEVSTELIGSGGKRRGGVTGKQIGSLGGGLPDSIVTKEVSGEQSRALQDTNDRKGLGADLS